MAPSWKPFFPFLFEQSYLPSTLLAYLFRTFPFIHPRSIVSGTELSCFLRLERPMTVPHGIPAVLPAFLSNFLFMLPCERPFLQLSCLDLKFGKRERCSLLCPSGSNRLFCFIPLARRCHAATPTAKKPRKANGQGKGDRKALR